jgi:hypothetical protein
MFQQNQKGRVQYCLHSKLVVTVATDKNVKAYIVLRMLKSCLQSMSIKIVEDYLTQADGETIAKIKKKNAFH